jgi:hypothetical protein
MSHHFDSPSAREDPRLNLCDFYLFDGAPGKTVIALTVNPDAGLSAPESFRDEGLYAFRFDLNGDAREELTFKVKFGEVRHANGHGHRHVQDYEVRIATGEDALRGEAGELLISGVTGHAVTSGAGISAFAGLAPDMFAGDSVALGAFRKALQAGALDQAAFENRQNYFARRNVSAIVLEVPTERIGSGRVHAWATVSLVGHAPEMQISRWGLPLMTNVFIPDQDMREAYNRAKPAEDIERFAGPIADTVERLAALAGSARDPKGYARQFIARMFPTMLPYELGTPACFAFASFNGRALTDDVMDVILTFATNTALVDGVAPDKSRAIDCFPYVGAPFSKEEQAGVVPHPRPAAATAGNPTPS